VVSARSKRQRRSAPPDSSISSAGWGSKWTISGNPRSWTGPSVLLAKKPGEHAWVIAERLLCEALDPRPKHVAVNRGPVDSTEGRARVVFDRELHQSGHLIARQPAGKAQCGVDACGYAGTRQVAAILDPAFCDVPRSQPVKEATICPVGGGGATLQEAGSGEQQRACADGGHDFGVAVGLPQIVEEYRIRQLAKRRGAATRDEDDVRPGMS